MALDYTGGSFVRRGDYNYVTTMDLHKPEYDSELTEAFGDQMLTGMLQMIGAEKGVSALEYNHFEEERIYPKIKATSAGAGAGATATFAIDAAATLSIPENSSPYGGTNSSTITVPRVGELILIKPASGVASADSYIRAIVDSVTPATPAFTATPLDSADSVPAIASAQEIVIYGNAHGEGSVQPASRQTRVTKKTNNLQTFKGTYEVTSTERDMLAYIDFKGKDGKNG